MISEERALILVTARFARATARIFWLALGLTIVSGGAMILDRGSRVAATVALLLGIFVVFFAVRLALDASLLEDVATEKVSTPDLDSALGSVFNISRRGRSWPQRCRGAKRLAMNCVLAATAQIVAVILIGWV